MQQTDISIAIIGLGPRGLNVLERIAAHVSLEGSSGLSLHIFEPGRPGEGIHHTTQPDYLQLNTVASQITMFMDHTVSDAGPLLPGPSLYQWAAGNKMYSLPLGPNTYLPRRAFGEYLNWVYDYLRAKLERHCKVVLHTCLAKNISHNKENGYIIEGDNGDTVNADYLFLTTGHSQNIPDDIDVAREKFVFAASPHNSHLKHVRSSPYPIDKQLEDIAPCATVAIEGMGLTATDAITALTVGRGGRFHRETAEGELIYQPSGKEPLLAMFSRSGLPFAARAANQKGVSNQYRARFLTLEQVSRWRWSETGNAKELDFFADVFPVLLRDMTHAYYLSHAQKRYGKAFARLLDETAVRLDAPAVEQILRRVCEDIPPFSWEALANPIPGEALGTSQDFSDWLERHLEDDLQEAKLGNLDSPMKAACDVLRDVRDNLRRAIDFGALSAQSHRRFMNEFVPVMNRLAVGPPLHRIEEMLALVRGGYLDIGFGPNSTAIMDSERSSFIVQSGTFPEKAFRADVLIRARVPKSTPEQDQSPLMHSLLQNELIRPYMNEDYSVGGIDVDERLHIIGSQGLSEKNAWALGTVCEGAKFYTYIVPRPFVNSTALVDAGRSVGEMFEQIRRHGSATRQVIPTQRFQAGPGSLVEVEVAV